MCDCEILLKNSKALKFYFIKTIFPFFVFATWVSVFTEHVPIENQQKKSKVGVFFLRTKFGPNQVQCCEKSKGTCLISRLFSCFAWGMHLKAREVVDRKT